MWRCSLQRLHPKHARQFIISIVRSIFPTLFGSLLSFLVSGFVKLCQNDVAMLSKGGSVDSLVLFIVFAHRAMFHFFFLFSFCIRFAPHVREREKERIVERSSIVIVCLFLRISNSFPDRVFSVRKICKFVCRNIVGTTGECDTQSTVY